MNPLKSVRLTKRKENRYTRAWHWGRVLTTGLALGSRAWHWGRVLTSNRFFERSSLGFWPAKNKIACEHGHYPRLSACSKPAVPQINKRRTNMLLVKTRPYQWSPLVTIGIARATKGNVTTVGEKFCEILRKTSNGHLPQSKAGRSSESDRVHYPVGAGRPIRTAPLVRCRSENQRSAPSASLCALPPAPFSVRIQNGDRARDMPLGCPLMGEIKKVTHILTHVCLSSWLYTAVFSSPRADLLPRGGTK